MKFKVPLFSLFLLLSTCSNSAHIMQIQDNEVYFSEFKSFADPYDENDILTLDEINDKIDENILYYKALYDDNELLTQINAYKGAELFWEDYYTNDGVVAFHSARSYRLVGGPFYFARLDRQTPYELVDTDFVRIMLDTGLPIYEVTFTDPLTPLYTIRKIGPYGELWQQSINNDSIELTWLTETLPESEHTINVVIPEKGELLPKKIYSNTTHGFSFEFPAYAFPLYDKNGNETQNEIAEAMTVFERHVSENESHFYIGPETGTLEKMEDPDGPYASQVVHVIKLLSGSEKELDDALKEHWGYFCEYTASVGTDIGFDSVVWDVVGGANVFSCPGGTAWFDPESKTLYLNSAVEEASFGYNELTFDLIPEDLILLKK